MLEYGAHTIGVDTHTDYLISVGFHHGPFAIHCGGCTNHNNANRTPATEPDGLLYYVRTHACHHVCAVLTVEHRTDHLIDVVTLYTVETGLVTRYVLSVSPHFPRTDRRPPR